MEKNQIHFSDVFAHSGQSKPGQLAEVPSVTNAVRFKVHVIYTND